MPGFGSCPHGSFSHGTTCEGVSQETEGHRYLRYILSGIPLAIRQPGSTKSKGILEQVFDAIEAEDIHIAGPVNIET